MAVFSACSPPPFLFFFLLDFATPFATGLLAVCLAPCLALALALARRLLLFAACALLLASPPARPAALLFSLIASISALVVWCSVKSWMRKSPFSSSTSDGVSGSFSSNSWQTSSKCLALATRWSITPSVCIRHDHKIISKSPNFALSDRTIIFGDSKKSWVIFAYSRLSFGIVFSSFL